MRSPLLPWIVIVTAACAAQGDHAPAPGGGGGGVSFGGAQDMGAFRAALERGELPAPNLLDANGFFNEHYSATPAPTCGGLLCLTPGLSVGRDWLTGTHQATLQLAVSTTVDPASYQRLPMDLVVVVDRSGSMQQDGRLDKVKVGLHTLVDNLHDDDRLALIAFDHTVTHALPFGETLDRDLLHERIETLSPGGGTNLYAGLEAGFSMFRETLPNERQHRVIFLSDGHPTTGVTSRYEIIDLARAHIMRGIGLTSIGVGNDFDIELMRGLAEYGAGNYYYLEDASAASEVFSEELDYFMSPLALDVTIAATPSSGWTFGEVVGTPLWNAADNAMNIPAVFLASRTSQEPGEGRRGGGSMIFIHLEPTTDARTQVATLTLSYRLPGTSEYVSQTVTLDYAANPLETPVEPHLSSAEMAERYAMYNMFLGLRFATHSATYGVPACAAAGLEATRRNAVAWNERHPDPDIAADLELVDMYLANLRAHGVTADIALADCPNADSPYGLDGDFVDAYGWHPLGCSAAGGHASWLAILGVAALVVTRRRQRSC